MLEKPFLGWLGASAFLMLACPLLAKCFLGDVAMAACFLLFFIINPVFSILLGVSAGKNIRELLALPLLPAVFFIIGVWSFFTPNEPLFLLYAVGYFVLGAVLMAASAWMRAQE